MFVQATGLQSAHHPFTAPVPEDEALLCAADVTRADDLERLLQVGGVMLT